MGVLVIIYKEFLWSTTESMLRKRFMVGLDSLRMGVGHQKDCANPGLELSAPSKDFREGEAGYTLLIKLYENS